MTEFHLTNSAGHRLYAVEWPASEARGVVGLIHGVGEHCRRYDHLATRFNAAGFGVVGYDRQGFGRSEGRRGDAENLGVLLDEISQLVVSCERRYPDLPVFLYGHSMGGMLLLRYLIKRHPAISGAIVSAPHIQLSFQPSSLLVGIGKVMRRVYPTFSQQSDLDLDQLSRDPAVRSAYEADPYTHGTLSSRLGIDMLEAGNWLHTWRGELPVPTLLMHGTADGLTSYDASTAFGERNPSRLTFRAWDGLYHELHNEPEQEEVFRYVLDWLEQHLGEVHRPPASV